MRDVWLLLLVGLLVTQSVGARADELQSGSEIRRYQAPEATQGVAVDDEHFYAIGNRTVAKYRKLDGQLVVSWSATDEVPLRHLNSAIVLEGRLHAAHSNFPAYPEVSSIEIWDTNTLEHVESHSLGICEGSLTWIDWHDDAWWAVFAHYTEKVNDDPHAKDARWTSLVKFDGEWRRMAGWQFPAEVIARFEPHSCSGGSWSGDRMYCTGHDRGEVYELSLPRGGSTLSLRQTYAVPITGQAFAWDRSELGVLYGIDRPRGEVVVVKIPTLARATLETARRAPIAMERVGQIP